MRRTERTGRTAATPGLHSPRLTRGQKVAMVVVLAVLGLIFLLLVRHVLPPFALALIAAYVVSPLVDRLVGRTHLPRALAVTVVYLVILGLIVTASVAFIIPAISSEIGDMGRALPPSLRALESQLQAYQPLAPLGITFDPGLIPGQITEAGRGLLARTAAAVGLTIELLIHLLVFLVATFYLLVDGKQMTGALRSLVPLSYRSDLARLEGDITWVLDEYIRGQLLLVLIMSALSWVVLSPILHLQYALIISLLTGVLELFPWIGPVTAGAIASTVALLQTNDFGWPNWAFALVVAGTYFLLRQMEDYLVIPNLIGRVVQLHPLAVMFALLAGAALGGLLGLFIAVPVTAVLKILLAYLHDKLTEGPEIASPSPSPSGPSP